MWGITTNTNKNNLLLLFLISTLLQTCVKAAASKCDPLHTTGCPPDKALATSFIEDFTNASSSEWFTKEDNPGNVTFDATNGLGLTITERGDNPSFSSNFYIMFGKVEVLLQAAPGRGIVSSFFLQSDDLDEIDLEWIGSDNTQFQTNYFSKGNTTTYDRGQFEGVYIPTQEFHNYTIDWSMDKTTWSLDGAVVRTLLNTSSQGYPQTPMKIKFGIWAGGDPSNAKGTIEWAGGITDYADGPFTMYVKKVIVSDYSTGTSYSYDGTSGSWESIVAKDGEVYGRYSEAQTEFNELADGVKLSSSSSSSSTTTSTPSSSSSTVSNAHNTTTTILSSKKSATTTYSSSSFSLSSSSSSNTTTEISTQQPTTTSTTELSSTVIESTNTQQNTITTMLSSSSSSVSSTLTTQMTSDTTTKSKSKSKATSTSNESTHTVDEKSDNIASILSRPIFSICLLVVSFLMH